MKKEVTGQMLLKLPAWAQEHIKELERERDIAIRALNDYVDNQTESAIFYDDFVSIGEEKGPSVKRVFIQNHQIEVTHNGVHLCVTLRDNIDLSWEDMKRGMSHVAFVPTSLNAASLVAKENMR